MTTIEAKAVVLGAQAVGKTSVVMRCVRDMFTKDVASTIGAAFFTYAMSFGDYKVILQIWDTAGQERFKSMAPMYYRKATVAILVYDITDMASFIAIKSWVMELKRNIDRPVYMVLFGNKCDMSTDRQVDTAIAQDYAESIGAELMEMSALSQQGVKEGFQKIAEMLVSGSKVDTYAQIYDSNGVNRRSSSSHDSSNLYEEEESKSSKCSC